MREDEFNGLQVKIVMMVATMGGPFAWTPRSTDKDALKWGNTHERIHHL